jgi:hypothetical protein
VFTLTTGSDTFVGGPEDDTVNGTAATPNPGDRLTGGSGNDVVALYSSGTFHIDQLAIFAGFSTIALNNFTNGSGSQTVAVTEYGSEWDQLYFGSGAVSYHGGGGDYYITSPSIWNAGDAIDGSGTIYLNFNGSANAIYDLTTNSLAHIRRLYG